MQFTIPSANQDGSKPADLARVELYGYTGPSLGGAALMKVATLVGSVPVRPPPPDEAPPKAAPPSPGPELDQGAVATLPERLVGTALTPAVIDTRDKETMKPGGADRDEPPGARPLVSPLVGPLPTRFYVAVGVNTKGKPGPLSARVAVPLVDAPAPPSNLTVTYTVEAISLVWVPPPVVRVPIQAAATPGLLAATPMMTVLPGSTYNVYAVPAKGTTGAGEAAQAASRSAPPAAPLNPAPLAMPAFEIREVEFGAERCFIVRTLDQFPPLRLESDASAPTCVTLIDTFPPAVPQALAAVASEGSIGLIWEPNGESDLAGYLILRGEAPGETLQALTKAPVKETTYRDTTARPGVRYVYAVVAVDTATPQNVSPQSNRVEETAR